MSHLDKILRTYFEIIKIVRVTDMFCKEMKKIFSFSV